MVLWKICLFQTFGKEPTREELNPAVDVIWPNYAKGKLGYLRIANMIKRGFTGGDESKFHALYPDAIDTDLMFLASKMRAAASRGELDRLVIDPALAPARTSSSRCRRASRGPRQVLRHDHRQVARQAGVHDRHVQPDVRRGQGGLERGIKDVFAKDRQSSPAAAQRDSPSPTTHMDVYQ